MRRRYVSLRPPRRCRRKDAVDSEVIAAIYSFAHLKFQTGPGLRDIVRRHLGRNAWEVMPALYRFVTLDAHWAEFCEAYPAVANTIASHVRPETVPQSFCT